MRAPSPEQRRELGEFIRARREKLTPSGIGLPAAGRRRTPGLRREEVAQLAGFSTTWYTWLEQGRDVSVSAPALARLAAALRLGRAERTYLFDLAGRHDPDPGDAAPSVPPDALACVHAITCPAYLLDRSFTALSWNLPAQRLFVGWLDQDGAANLLRFIFQVPAARRFICDWESRARRVAAEFRAATRLHLEDPPIRDLIADLHRGSAEFARFWAEHAVLGREGGERTFQHPTDGFLRYRQVSFALDGAPEMKLTMLLPA
ncbi:MAG: helix-turn-helix domain-containing protein [Rhodospirillales bacterium]|nr:helix-turn-helix domain-containing protein [Rhodospirillales bacterium]